MTELLFQTKSLHELAFFRCKKNGKAPHNINGYKGAKVNFDLEGAFMNGYNIGLPMEPNKLIGIDMDVDFSKGYDGVSTIDELEKELGTLPRTYTQQTPRGGVHKVYLANNIIKPKGKIGKAVDVKFFGYLLFAGSSINGNYYRAIDGVTQDKKLYFSELPEKWVEYLNKEQNNKVFNSKVNVVKPSLKIVNFEKMFKNCAYLGYCQEFADILPEPEWHTMISILANCEGGEDLIHELSSPYSKYSFTETQNKINYARQFGYSQSCAYISSNYPEICKNCQSSIKERKE